MDHCWSPALSSHQNDVNEIRCRGHRAHLLEVVNRHGIQEGINKEIVSRFGERDWREKVGFSEFFPWIELKLVVGANVTFLSVRRTRINIYFLFLKPIGSRGGYEVGPIGRIPPLQYFLANTKYVPTTAT